MSSGPRATTHARGPRLLSKSDDSSHKHNNTSTDNANRKAPALNAPSALPARPRGRGWEWGQGRAGIACPPVPVPPGHLSPPGLPGFPNKQGPSGNSPGSGRSARGLQTPYPPQERPKTAHPEQQSSPSREGLLRTTPVTAPTPLGKITEGEEATHVHSDPGTLASAVIVTHGQGSPRQALSVSGPCQGTISGSCSPHTQRVSAQESLRGAQKL